MSRNITKISNFQLVDKIDDALRLKLLNEIGEQADLWFDDIRRQTIREQSETNSIILRNADRDLGYTGPIWNIQRSCDVLMDRFPLIKSVLNKYAPLARVMIVRLAPWSQVYRHLDYGPYYERDRFHLVLRSTGSVLTSGDEACTMREGELWWFNNSLLHQAFNHSDEWRIHVIFDTETPRYKINRRG